MKIKTNGQLIGELQKHSPDLQVVWHAPDGDCVPLGDIGIDGTCGDGSPRRPEEVLRIMLTEEWEDEFDAGPSIVFALGKRIHLIERHNQYFERCESRWCNPTGTLSSGPGEEPRCPKCGALTITWQGIGPGTREPQEPRCTLCGGRAIFREDEGVWRHAGNELGADTSDCLLCDRYGYPIDVTDPTITKPATVQPNPSP